MIPPLTEPLDPCPPRALRVLLVEDDPDAALTTARLLRREGHDVHVAGDGASALDAAAASDPDVVLLGGGGYGVAQRLRGRRAPRTPLLVAITGQDQRPTDAVIDLHLAQPVDASFLQGLLRRFQRVVG